jgi:hypothetical protein
VKYRIIEHQENGVAESFEPQFNPFLFWRSWRNPTYREDAPKITFDTYKEALMFLKEQSDIWYFKRQKELSKREIVHKLY